jgi:hypothetical protein
MLLQTNSYIVPRDKRAEHQRLIRRFRQTLKRLGCDHFEVYEQVGPNWSNSESSGRYVQILRFVDRKHQLSVQQAERTDATAQAVIADFCDLINFPYQQQQGLFAVGFYNSVLPIAPKRGVGGELISTVEHEVLDEEPELSVERLDTVGPAEPKADTQLEGLRAATVERHHEMIDTVVLDGTSTAPGELLDMLEADAPVDGLDGTPPETELVRDAGPVAPVSSGVPLEAELFKLTEDESDAHEANGFVLEDAFEAKPVKDRPTW